MTAKQRRHAEARMIAQGRLLASLQASAGRPVYTCPTWGVDLAGHYVTGYLSELLAGLPCGYRIESPALNYYRLVN
jgi:hypothetical protein